MITNRQTPPLTIQSITYQTPNPTRTDVPRYEVEQGPGELLFVPSGWHHSVTNLTGCLSLNRNWSNGSALQRVWAFLKGEAAAVKARLKHLEATFEGDGSGWARQCEVVLRANAAMNLTVFVGLLVGKAARLVEDKGRGGKEQQWRDVGRIVRVLKEVRADPGLLNSLFPPHLEAQLLGPQEDGEEGEEDVWPPPPPPPQEALRPLVVAWLDGAIGAAEAAMVGERTAGQRSGDEESASSIT